MENSSFAVQLIRYEGVREHSRTHIAQSQLSLGELQQLTLGWLSACRVLDMANTDATLFFPLEYPRLQKVTLEVASRIASDIEKSPIWQTMATMYRYAVQGDASEIDSIMRTSAQNYFHYRVGAVLRVLHTVQADWDETEPYCGIEAINAPTAPGFFLALRFLARCKLDYPGALDCTLIRELSAKMNVTDAGISLPEFALLSNSSYSKVKSLTARHNRERSGLYTKQDKADAYVEVANARQWLEKQSGFIRSSGVTYQPEPASAPALAFVESSREATPEITELNDIARELDPELFATDFCLIDLQGRMLFPVRMALRGTTERTFRLSKGGAEGNLLKNTLYVTDPAEVKVQVLQYGMAVRAATPDGSQPNLYKLSGRSIQCAFDFTTQSFMSTGK